LEGYYSIFSLGRELVGMEGRNGERVRIGANPWVGSGEIYKIIGNMIATLQEKHVYSHVQDSLPEKSIVWNQE
jgi:hypothetical protein